MTVTAADIADESAAQIHAPNHRGARNAPVPRVNAETRTLL